MFLGTSTSGILQTELAYRRRDPATGALPDDFNYRTTHNSFSLADFMRAYFGLEGTAMAISTACSSSAKVFAAAARQIELGLIDAAIVGGVDTLCLTTLYGFASLQLTSPQTLPARTTRRATASRSARAPASPCSSARPIRRRGSVLLLGVGESSDAYHMSSPHPEGLGATLAMEAALQSAGLAPADIDYINLHGTATPANDAAEGTAVAALFGDARALQLDQGRDRPHAGRGRRHRSRHLRAGTAPMACCPAARARATPDPAFPSTTCSRAASWQRAPRAEQFLRLRRQQLQPCLRSRRMSAPSLTAWIEGIGFLGPGLPDWPAARAVLRGEQPYAAAPVGAAGAGAAAAGRAPPRQPRRQDWRSPSALEAIAQAGADAGAAGDGVHRLPAATATTATRCANSWRATTARSRRRASTIRCTTPPPATGASPPASMAPCQVLCAYDASFGAGLLDAAGAGGARRGSRCC